MVASKCQKEKQKGEINKTEKERLWNLDEVNKKIKEYSIKIPIGKSLVVTHNRLWRMQQQLEKDKTVHEKSLEDIDNQLAAVKDILSKVGSTKEISKG